MYPDAADVCCNSHLRDSHGQPSSFARTFSEALIGSWGGAAEIIVDPYSYASQAMVAVTAIMIADVGVRHPEASVVNKSAKLS